MGHEVAVAIISGATGAGAALGGALGGVALTARVTTKQRKEDRLERSRLEQREAIIEMLDAGRAWTTRLEPMLMAMGVVRDPVELTNMDSFREFGIVGERYRRALVTARLIVTDDQLRPAVVLLSAAVDKVEVYSGPIVEEAYKRGKATPESIGKGLAYCDVQSKELERLEHASLTRLAADATEASHPGWVTRLSTWVRPSGRTSAPPAGADGAV